MLALKKIHHVALICSEYERSKKFYTQVLGFEVAGEYYRAERKSFKLDLVLNGHYTLELFSFPSPPPRVSRPEACGLRHLAFEVEDVEVAVKQLQQLQVMVEPIRIDEYTNKRFTFFFDPDGLPLELYEK